MDSDREAFFNRGAGLGPEIQIKTDLQSQEKHPRLSVCYIVNVDVCADLRRMHLKHHTHCDNTAAKTTAFNIDIVKV